MPLMKSKSKQAFKENIKAEMSAGKPQKQALAIAYAVKRKAQHKAMGGMIDDSIESDDEQLPSEQFLSAEEGLESPFQNEGMSDEQEIDEMNMLGRQDARPDRKQILSSIVDKMRRRK